MAEQPRKKAKVSKGKEKAFSAAQKCFEAWFPEAKLRQDYLMFHSTKEVMRPHYISLEWFAKAGFEFASKFTS